MMKKIITLLGSIFFLGGYCQTLGEGIKPAEEINKLYPASPTSNNLMKFEEIPVSYYTGVPDIKIPIFNISTINPKVVLDVQLKYHTLSAKPDDKSGEVGLGWNLIAGGTISRTIRGGAPDNKVISVLFASTPKSRYGIYHDIYNPTSKWINGQNININEYLFDVAMGKIDTEYDLYQYNFWGKTGRFIVKKDINGNYIADKLDKNNLQIICNMNPGTKEITSFIIIDDQGIKYTFDPFEKSEKNTTKIKVGILGQSSGVDLSEDFGLITTGFHLSKVDDQNNVNLIEYKYDLNSTLRYKDPYTLVKREVIDISKQVSPSNAFIDNRLIGGLEKQETENYVQTKLLTSIEIKNKGKINFTYELGRNDSNYINSNELYKLKSIYTSVSSNNSSNYIDKYSFVYDYVSNDYTPKLGQSQFLQKMILKKVVKEILNNNSEYSIDYFPTTSNESDDWGFYKGSTGVYSQVIKSITYPTKGKVEFEYGENEYSHDPENGIITGYNQTEIGEYNTGFDSFNQQVEFFTIQSPRTIAIDCSYGNLVDYTWKVKLYKKNSDGSISTTPTKEFGDIRQTPVCSGCPDDNPGENGPISERVFYVKMEDAGSYVAIISNDLNSPTPSGGLWASFAFKIENTTFIPAKKLKGGGPRINAINYYSDTNQTLAKKITYQYDDLNDNDRSSGALIFPKPIYKYDERYSYILYPNTGLNWSDLAISFGCDLKTTTNYNILPVQKTQGSDVGYQYVTIQITDNNNNTNGKTIFKFRSPIEYPNEEQLYLEMPIRSIPNQDYLRGQSIWDEKYTSSNEIISRNQTEYNANQYQKVDGIKSRDNFYNNVIGNLYGYENYQAFVNAGNGSIDLITPYINYEYYGTVLPSQKEEENYFYNNGNPKSSTNTTTYNYNELDYITNQSVIFPDTTTQETIYQYPHEQGNQYLIDKNIIGIPLETEVKKNGVTLSKTNIKYPESQSEANTKTSGLPLPYEAFGKNLDTGGMESQVTYDQYDSKGNLLQYTIKSDVPTAIIWGYNQTQPIAKIEGATYAQVSGLAAAIISASNDDANDAVAGNPKEQDLLIALDAFRTNSALSGYQITTYSYDPLIGVRSITPPSGIREVYIYDTANRLKEVKDINGNILKEYQYHYKP